MRPLRRRPGVLWPVLGIVFLLVFLGYAHVNDLLLWRFGSLSWQRIATNSNDRYGAEVLFFQRAKGPHELRWILTGYFWGVPYTKERGNLPQVASVEEATRKYGSVAFRDDGLYLGRGDNAIRVVPRERLDPANIGE